MSSKKNRIRFPYTLAFRLTLWYAGMFALSSFIAFLLFYFLITSVLRQQVDQDLTKQAGVFSSLLKTRGINAVASVASLEAQAAGEKKIFFRLLHPSGEVFSSSNMSYWKDIGIGRQAIRDLSMRSPSVFETISIPERKHKVRILYTVVGPTLLLQLGQSMENISRFIEAFQRIFIITMAVLIALAAVVGWFMARRAVSGVESITRTALQITGGELKQRVPVKPRGDEIDQLATTFNSMLDRIESLVTNIKEMSDNIAHDLKSPITRIRGVAEVTLTTGKDLQEFKSMGASIIEECDRLLDMINTMLMISKTEAGVGNLSLEPIDMDKVIQDAVELFQPMAEDKQINLVCNTPEEINTTGDMRLIQRMIANFIDNAIKYTDPSGTVVVSMKSNPLQQVEITVMDTGIGIAPEELPHIFDRFYRCDESRSKAGVGLGLSLARTIARAHGGDVTVTSRPGKGSTFTITLSGETLPSPS